MIKVLKSPPSHTLVLLLPLLSSQTLEGSEMLKGALTSAPTPVYHEDTGFQGEEVAFSRSWS